MPSEKKKPADRKHAKPENKVPPVESGFYRPSKGAILLQMEKRREAAKLVSFIRQLDKKPVKSRTKALQRFAELVEAVQRLLEDSPYFRNRPVNAHIIKALADKYPDYCGAATLDEFKTLVKSDPGAAQELQRWLLKTLLADLRCETYMEARRLGLPTDPTPLQRPESLTNSIATVQDTLNCLLLDAQAAEEKPTSKPPAEAEDRPPVGVSLRNVAFVLQDGQEDLINTTLQKWNKSKRTKPDPVGKSESGRHPNLYEPTEILDWVEKEEKSLPRSKREMLPEIIAKTEPAAQKK